MSDCALQVVELKQTPNGVEFDVNESKAEQIFHHPLVKDKKVVIISVAGAYRKGKSFLLNFFLRYLSREGNENWLGQDHEQLEGFHWCGGSTRDTTGILLWSKPFVRKLSNGDEVAVLLMDTQGTFDSTATVKQCSTIFALSTLLSSVQIYNLSSNIQENDLQHLHLFTDYGRLALNDNSYDKPFQTLWFLVRDWFCDDHPYGVQGGQLLLENRLQISHDQAGEMKLMRNFLFNCFEELSCFLMPFPGMNVARNGSFCGHLRDIDPDFKTHLKTFVKSILSTEQLVVKKINGAGITGSQLYQYMKSFMGAFKGNELPVPETIVQVMAKENNLAAINDAKKYYQSEMDKHVAETEPYLHPEDLVIKHTLSMTAAFKRFNAIKKIGGREYGDKYEKELIIELCVLYKLYVGMNKAKKSSSLIATIITSVYNVFNTATTTFILCTVIAAFGLSFLR